MHWRFLRHHISYIDDDPHFLHNGNACLLDKRAEYDDGRDSGIKITGRAPSLLGHEGDGRPGDG